MHKFLNRMALVIRAKEAYWEWVIGLDDADSLITLEELRSEATVYLVPEVENELDKRRIMESLCRNIFIQQLYTWSDDEKIWPEVITFEKFAEWFDYEFLSVVIDAAETPLEIELQ